MRLSTIATEAAGAEEPAEPARAEAREPLELPREKPWKKARHVGSTESGLSSQVSYICSMMAELAWVGTVVELMEDLCGEERKWRSEGPAMLRWNTVGVSGNSASKRFEGQLSTMNGSETSPGRWGSGIAIGLNVGS